MTPHPEPEERLRALANAATQGERYVNEENEIVVRVGEVPNAREDINLCITDDGNYPPEPPDAAFIAACSPSVVLALLDEVQRLRASLVEATRDTKRMDWLERHPVNTRGWRTKAVRDLRDVGPLPTLREAIDAASLHPDTPK